MRIRKPEHITDEQYKRYLVQISEILLNRVHTQNKNLDFLSYSAKTQVQDILTPIVTETPINENIYKLADASLAIKQIKTPQYKRMEELADIVYDTHLALHTLKLVSAKSKEHIEVDAVSI